MTVNLKTNLMVLFLNRKFNMFNVILVVKVKSWTMCVKLRKYYFSSVLFPLNIFQIVHQSKQYIHKMIKHIPSQNKYLSFTPNCLKKLFHVRLSGIEKADIFFGEKK